MKYESLVECDKKSLDFESFKPQRCVYRKNDVDHLKIEHYSKKFKARFWEPDEVK